MKLIIQRILNLTNLNRFSGHSALFLQTEELLMAYSILLYLLSFRFQVWDTMIIESALKTYYNSDLMTMIQAIQQNITVCITFSFYTALVVSCTMTWLLNSEGTNPA